MTPPLPDNVLLLGKILRPHGLEGLLRVWSYARSAASFLDAGEVILRSVPGKTGSYRVLSAKEHKNIILMQLEGLDSINQAEAYRGAEVWVNTEAITREEGEYFWRELIGLHVFSDAGAPLGAISRIIPAGGHDIYVVGNGEREFFVPATHETVKEIDLDKGRMTVSATEGLLDLNAV